MRAAAYFRSTVLPTLEERHLARLRRDAPRVEWAVCASREEFVAALPECEIAISWEFKREWLAAAPKLRLFSTPAAGHDWVEIRSRPGLEVTFGTFHGELMAETALALMLALARGIREALVRRDGNPWPRNEITSTLRGIRGSRALILGFGNIGKWIGRLLSPLGVKVWGVNRTDLSRPDWFGPDDSVRPLADLDLLLPMTDHLILALPGGEETNGMMDARRLELLPARACVYNLGRGNSLDGAALADALARVRLAGAGLDVYDKEPLPADSPLRHCPNTILLPHVSAFAPNYMDLYLDELVPALKKME